jgi:hypothetical protein
MKSFAYLLKISTLLYLNFHRPFQLVIILNRFYLYDSATIFHYNFDLNMSTFSSIMSSATEKNEVSIILPDINKVDLHFVRNQFPQPNRNTL